MDMAITYSKDRTLSGKSVSAQPKISIGGEYTEKDTPESTSLDYQDGGVTFPKQKETVTLVL